MAFGSLPNTLGGGGQASGAYLPGGGVITGSSGAITLTAGGSAQNITLTPSGTGRVHLGDTGTGTITSTPETAIVATMTSSLLTPHLALCNAASISQQLVLGWDSTNGRGSIQSYWYGASSVLALQLQPLGGRVLLGTTTDSGALLQVGTNTTNTAGGMVFGTDTFLSRLAAGHFGFTGPGTEVLLSLNSANGQVGIIQTSGTSLIVKTAGTTALTLDASQNATFAGDVATANAKAFYWGTRSVMTSPSDGVIRLANSAGTDFTRLQFGGTTASFPALRRVGTALGVRLADDSGDGGFTAGTIVASSCVNISGAAATVAAGVVSYGGTTATTVGAAGGASALPATPTGYIIVNVAGTQMKVPYYAN